MAAMLRTVRRWRATLAAGACLASVVAVQAAQGDKQAIAPFVPALRVDFPDPFVLQDGPEFLAYATNTERGRINVPMATSRDLATWTQLRDAAKPGQLHDAMPTLPAWAKRGLTWAPEVIKTDKGFVLYYTARHTKSDLQCVGAATAANARGPFVTPGAEPIVCQSDLGGTIDASPFRDADGTLYLYFKNDGNNPRAHKPTEIFAQKMTPDGLSLVDTPVSLMRNDQPWEAHVIEAPTMVRVPGGGYQMFYSANHYGWETHQRLSPYAMGYATCTSAIGPCVDAPGNPILFSRMGAAGCISGPGHQSIFTVGARSFITYHGWATTSGCRKAGDKRHMYISPLVWNQGKPEVRITLRRAGS